MPARERYWRLFGQLTTDPPGIQRVPRTINLPGVIAAIIFDKSSTRCEPSASMVITWVYFGSDKAWANPAR